MCLVWKIIGFHKRSNPGPKHLGSFECKNCAIFSALLLTQVNLLWALLLTFLMVQKRLQKANFNLNCNRIFNF